MTKTSCLIHRGGHAAALGIHELPEERSSSVLPVTTGARLQEQGQPGQHPYLSDLLSAPSAAAERQRECWSTVPQVSAAAPGESWKTGLTLPNYIHTLTEAFKWIELQKDQKELASAMAAMLHSDYPTPDHFVTLTLRDARRRDERVQLGMNALDRAWRSFYRHVRKLIHHRFEFLYVVELQQRGVPHLHCLTWNTAALNQVVDETAKLTYTQTTENYCWKAFGRSRLQPYKAGHGAGEYVLKYLFKDRSVHTVSISRGLQRLRSVTRAAQPWTEPGEQRNQRAGWNPRNVLAKA